MDLLKRHPSLVCQIGCDATRREDYSWVTCRSRDPEDRISAHCTFHRDERLFSLSPSLCAGAPIPIPEQTRPSSYLSRRYSRVNLETRLGTRRGKARRASTPLAASAQVARPRGHSFLQRVLERRAHTERVRKLRKGGGVRGGGPCQETAGVGARSLGREGRLRNDGA